MPAVPLPPDDFRLLCEVIKAVARHSNLSPEDAEDFSQNVHLKLLEKNYAPLAQFAGRSSLRTFLTTVVRRLLLDWRNERYGKWRPSAAARKLGPAGVAIDRLMSRDGHTPDEAVAMLAGRLDGPNERQLNDMAGRIPVRPRVVVVSDSEIEHLSAGVFADPIEARELVTRTETVRSILRRAFGGLSIDDRHLLHLRFGRCLPVVTIASLLGTDAKPLYRRIDGLLQTIREAFVLAGFTVDEKRRRPRAIALRRRVEQ